MLADCEATPSKTASRRKTDTPDARPRVLMYDVDTSTLRSNERVQTESELKSHAETVNLTRITTGDRDFGADVAEHRPDFVIFAGMPERPVAAPKVRNTDQFPELPRVGLHTSDVFAPMWWSNYQRFRELGVHAMFSPHVCPGVDTYENSHIPAYYLPRMVNSDLFHDYGEEKQFHVGFFGSGFNKYRRLYNWRSQIADAMSEQFITITTGRPDVIHRDDPLIPYGEKYARMINKCYFAPACSTSVRRPVEKVLQIPASMTCLVTEQNTLLEEYGFRDMANCVVADENNVVDKLRHLLANPNRLREITTAGYRLVHDNYLGAQMRAMRNWYEAYAARPEGGAIYQTGVLDFEATAPSQAPTRQLRADVNPARADMLRGFDHILRGDMAQASTTFYEAINVQDFFTPANIGYAITKLYERDTNTALNHLRPNVAWLEMMSHRYLEHDPALIAYFALFSLVINSPDSADRALALSRGRRHPLLQSVRLILELRRGEKSPDLDTDALNAYIFGGQNCESECPLNFGDAHGYLEHFIRILSANGQKGLCRRIERLF